MKFILHCENPDNLSLMARAAKHCAEKDMPEGHWRMLSYERPDGSTVASVSYVKRKSCVTLFEQPLHKEPTP